MHRRYRDRVEEPGEALALQLLEVTSAKGAHSEELRGS
jgi:hypothetical protein